MNRFPPKYQVQHSPIQPSRPSSGADGCLGPLAGFVVGGMGIGTVAFDLLGGPSNGYEDLATMFFAAIIGLVGGIVVACFISGRSRTGTRTPPPVQWARGATPMRAPVSHTPPATTSWPPAHHPRVLSRGASSCGAALAGFLIGGLVIGGIAFEALYDNDVSSGMFIDSGQIAAMFWATVVGLTGGTIIGAVTGGYITATFRRR